jgi:hypothetical protein
MTGVERFEKRARRVIARMALGEGCGMSRDFLVISSSKLVLSFFVSKHVFSKALLEC